MNANDERITEQEIKLAKYLAHKIGSQWALVETDDLESHLILWLLENQKYVTKYRHEEGGQSKLFAAMKRHAAKYSAQEQTIRSGRELDSGLKYSIAQIEAILVEYFNQASPHENDETRDVILDIKIAFNQLDNETQKLLSQRYLYEWTYRQISAANTISPTGARKKIRRGLRRIQYALEGD
jgi:DNA-directed RNA polymerase specialized sigma24 family protein